MEGEMKEKRKELKIKERQRGGRGGEESGGEEIKGRERVILVKRKMI